MQGGSGCHDERVVSLAARYERGEHVAVWDELRHQLVSAADCAAVAELTMRRVAGNVDIVVDRLRAVGWRWAYPETARQAPTDADLAAITAVEERLGPLSVALRACLMYVGEVWLCGTLRGWEPPWFAFDDLDTYPAAGDPLVLPPAAWLAAELAEWDSNEWVEPKRPYRFGFAPDELHKAGISGGTHDMVLPAGTADPPLQGVEYREGVTLVEYLRASLGHGGFAGAEFMTTPPPLLAEISAELVPF
jgi:hypothetical protein